MGFKKASYFYRKFFAPIVKKSIINLKLEKKTFPTIQNSILKNLKKITEKFEKVFIYHISLQNYVSRKRSTKIRTQKWNIYFLFP